MHFVEWHFGLDSMRNAKLRRTWRQRLGRFGRRKPETMIKIGDDQGRMVLLTDRLHDPYFPAVESIHFPFHWWVAADRIVERKSVKEASLPAIHYRIEINHTELVSFLHRYGQSNRRYIVAHHQGTGTCWTESGNAEVNCGFYMNPGSDKFIRLMLQIVSYELPQRQCLSYPDFLMLDDSSFMKGWRRVFYEWLYLSLPNPIKRLMSGGIMIMRRIRRVGSRAIFGDRA